MKNWLLLLALAFGICVQSHGQNISFNFIGKNILNNESMPVDSVYIYNISNDTDTLIRSNSLSIVISSTEITETTKSDWIKSYPNPFSNEINLEFYSNQNEKAKVIISTINGQTLGEWNYDVGIGLNKLVLKSNTEGILIVNVISSSIHLNAKIICVQKSGTMEMSGFAINNNSQALDIYKSASFLNGNFSFQLGDSVKLIGYSKAIESENILDAPLGGKDYTFLFDPTDYLPIADFGWSDSIINQGSSISFFDQSSNSPENWEWDFGDGNTSADQNPMNEYLLPGTYTVSLIASNSYGADTITKENSIVVNSLTPIAGFTVSDTIINEGGTINFTDQSSNSPSTWLWDFGDGSTSTNQNPSHIYNALGTYTITLIVSNNYGADTIQKENYIEVDIPRPRVDFVADATTIDEGSEVNFSDLSLNSPTSWLWDFGDGNTANEQNPKHIYPVPGTYTVTLIASNGIGADTLTKVNYITVKSLKPIADFTVNDTFSYINEELSFTDLSTNLPTSWKWDFGDGDTSNIQNPVHIYEETGFFHVTLVASNSYGSDTIKKENYIRVDVPKPIAGFTASDTLINQGEEVSFTDQTLNNPTAWNWDFGDGNTDNIQNPSHIYNLPGNYSVTLVATNAYGSDTIVQENYIVVNSLAPQAELVTSDTIINEGEEVAFTDLSSNTPDSWSWDFGDGSTSDQQNPVHLYNTPGAYSISLIVSNVYGSDTLKLENFIIVNSLAPQAAFVVNDSIIDQGQEVSFTDLSTNSPTSWKWEFGDGDTSVVQNPMHVYSEPGMYTVSLISSNSYGSDTLAKENYILVNIIPPLANFSSSDTTINQGEEISFTDQSTNNPTAWHWDFGDGDTSNIQNPTHLFSQPGIFTVTLIASNIAGSDTIKKTNYIHVNSLVPVAAYSASDTTINEEEEISFTDLSTNTPTAWHWDFGDGDTSNIQNPSHIFSEPGIFTVTLIASNTYGSDTLSKVNYVIVNSLSPVAAFTASDSAIEKGTEVFFTDLTTNTPTSWSWEFGDGDTSSLQNPSHIYNETGSYTVTLIASNSYGSDTLTKINYIAVDIPQPEASFTADLTTIIQGESVSFTDQSTNSPSSWNWDFGDDSISTEQNPVHIFNETGSFTVTLIVFNSAGSDTLSKENYIVVNIPKPEVAFTANNTIVNQADQVSFTDESTNTPTSWNWDFGDGASSTEQNPDHVYVEPGAYTVSLIASNATGSDTLTKENYIVVNSLVPVADFEANDTTIIQGDEVSFTDLSANSPTSWNWNFGDGSTSTTPNPNHIFSEVGSFTVTLIAINSFGSDTIAKENYIVVAIPKPVAAFTADNTSINQGEQVSFTDESTNTPTSWNWDFGDGSTSTSQNPDHTYSDPGTYSVSLITSNATGSDTLTKVNYIMVNSLVPVAAFTASDTSIKEGDEVTFTDQSTNAPTSWDWDLGDGATSTLQNPSHVYNSSGSYSVTLIASNSYGADTITKENYIAVDIPKPEAAFISDKTNIILGDEISFTDQSTNTPSSWNWDFGDGSTSSLQNPDHIYTETGSFNVTLIASNSTGSDTLTKENYIVVNIPKPVVAFTANTTTINQGEQVDFTDESTNTPTSWNWDFGDGSASSSQNPSHTYSAPGTYTVSLIASNATGSDTLTKENYIMVNSLVPVAAFEANSTSITLGEEVSFTDQSTNTPSSWNWDFGDGGSSTTQNPNHTYNNTGSYTVTLIVSNTYGSDTLSKTDYITVDEQDPVLLVSPTSLDFDSVTTQLTFDITNNGGGTLTWSLSESISWLSLSPVSGETTSETDEITVTVDRSSLTPDTYMGTISVSSNGGNQNIDVSMKVVDSSSNQPSDPGWKP